VSHEEEDTYEREREREKFRGVITRVLLSCR
jgi:hypothetical protein